MGSMTGAPRTTPGPPHSRDCRTVGGGPSDSDSDTFLSRSRSHAQARSDTRPSVQVLILSASPPHEDQPSRPYGQWQRLIAQLRSCLSAVAACSRFAPARAPASQRQWGSAAAQCRWMLDLLQLERPALSAVGGAWQHAACCAFSSRRLASCRSSQRRAAIFGARCTAAAGLVAEVADSGMQPAGPWPLGLQVTRKVARFGTHTTH